MAPAKKPSRNLSRHGLPADAETERFVLGSVLRRADVNFPLVAAVLSATDFSTSAHQLLWERMAEIAGRGDSVDRVTLGNLLRDRNELDPIGGLTYLISLDDGMPDLPNLDDYIRRVKEKSMLRAAALALEDAFDRVCAPSAGVSEIDAAARLLQDIGGDSPLEHGLELVEEGLTKGRRSPLEFLEPTQADLGIPSPWAGLNNLMNGLGKGQMMILAARPSVGKTTAGLQWAVQTAQRGVGVAFFSIEMTADEILRKLVAGNAGVDLIQWKRGHLTRDERQRLAAAYGFVVGLPLALDDQSITTIARMRRALVRHRARHPLGLIVVDYLQLVQSPSASRSSTRADDVAQISFGLKAIAKDLDVPVIALSQISRAAEKDKRRPQLSDLRESGAIEQDADLVAFLHRSDRLTELRLAKHRGGAIGNIDLHLDGRHGRFVEISADRGPHEQYSTDGDE